MLDGLKRKPNRIWVYKANEFYIRSMKSFFQDNDIDMYLMQNEENLLLLKDVLEP